MTRKRYVKQLMAVGVPRNTAIRMAAGFRRKGWPYNAALRVTVWVVFRQTFEARLEVLSPRTGVEARADG